MPRVLTPLVLINARVPMDSVEMATSPAYVRKAVTNSL